MRCPSCGVDVFEKAVFCHKCGHRLDAAAQEFAPSAERGPEAAAAGSHAAEAAATNGAATEPPPAERLKEAAAARQQTADEAEHEVWQGGFSPKAMIGDWILTSLATVVVLVFAVGWWPGVGASAGAWLGIIVGLLVLWFVQVGRLLVRRMGVRYQLTNQRFMHETGILRRVMNRIEVIDIDDVTCEQGPIERLVGVGSIRIASSDRTHPELLMPGIENVREVASTIDEIRRRERRRRGLHIESI